MKFTIIALARTAIASALAIAAVAAHADTYDFELTGDHTASFQLPSMVDPNTVGGYYFVVRDVTGTFDGVAATNTTITFYNAPSPYGAIQINGTANVYVTDAVLYTGGEVTPTFKLGTFDLIGRPGALTISNVSAVPEPTGAALSLAGLGMVGVIAARRRKAVGASAAMV